MTEHEIQTMLDQLASLRAASDVLALQKQALVDTVLTDEIKAKLADIDAEFADNAQDIGEKTAALETEVKAAVIAHGASVKGTFLQCVYQPGRVTWDNKLIAGFALAYPKLNEARKEGEPFVQFKDVK